MNRKPSSLTMMLWAVVVPPLIQAIQMIALDGTPIDAWLNQSEYGPLMVLGEVAIGSVFLFRALTPRFAFLSLIVYVPLAVLLIHGIGLVVAGAVFNDYL